VVSAVVLAVGTGAGSLDPPLFLKGWARNKRPPLFHCFFSFL